MLRRLTLILALGAPIAACATYHAVPIDAGIIAQSYSKKDLDAVAAQAELARIAPDSGWNGSVWDRLGLFGAAMALNPKIAEARAHAKSAEAAARAAKAGPSINLSLTAEYARTAPESSPWLYGATSDIPVDLGVKRAVRVKSANLASIVAHVDYAESVWSVRIALRRALIENLLTAREVKAAVELRALRTRQLTAMQARFNAGENTRVELERTRADAGADSRRLADANARLLTARGALAEALGVSLRSLDGVKFIWANFDSPDALDLARIEDLRSGALLMRADVLRAVTSYDQAELDLRGEIARQWPELHIGPGYTWERGLVKLPFTLGLVLPPLDFNKNAIKAAEARRAEAGKHLESIVASAQTSIDAALAERDASGETLTRIRDADLPAASAAAKQADLEIANGGIDRVDWTAPHIGNLLAELAEIDALRRVHNANSALEDSLRQPLEGPELAIAQTALRGGQK